MKNNICIPDATQETLIEELRTTEKLLSKVASKLSRKDKNATIYTMPDLGISSNVTRMCGGFFTGMCATWETDVPFVPVDATVNVCGTAVYKISNEITVDEFKNRIERVIKNDNSYSWNYNRGNHFVILAYSDGKDGLEKGQYLVLHASAAEYKKQNMTEGLYPVKGNWYYDDIKTIYDQNSNRYLRYISGNTADKFYNIANMLLNFNKERNRYFAEKVLENLIENEVVNISHYGMPSKNSVCIGSQWNEQRYTLLTAPGKTIYIIDPIKNINRDNCFIHCGQEFVLSPHGLGLELSNDCNIKLNSENLNIGNKTFTVGDSIMIDVDSTIRGYHEGEDLISKRVNNVLKACNGKIFGKLTQIASVTKNGFTQY